MTSRFTAAWAVIASVLLAACGGGGSETPRPTVETVELPSRMTLQAWQLSRGTVAPVGAASVLGLAQVDEVARLSRSRALADLGDINPLIPNNGFVTPPLHFSAVRVVEAAARGETLNQWQSLFPAASVLAIDDALATGVERRVLVNAASQLEGSLFKTLEGPINAPLWLPQQGLSVSDWPAQGYPAATRLATIDTLNRAWRWSGAVSFDGVWESALPQQRVVAPMLSLSSDVKSLAGAGYRALALRGEAGRRLVVIEPTGSMIGFTRQQLDAAIIESSRGFNSAAWASLTNATMVLPRDAGIAGEVSGFGVNALALDELRANLGAIDGGGTFVQDTGVQASMRIEAGGLNAQGSRTLKFIFSPFNPFNGGSVTTMVNLTPVPPCPRPTPDLRPFYLLELDANDRVVWLARWAALGGESCV